MADSGYSSGAAAGGGNDWEVVSLTASTYAAAPGPVLPLLDAHDNKTELPPPPPAASAIFMSQHFKLPPADEHESLLPLNGCQQQEFAPVTPRLDDDDDLRMLFFAEKDGEKGIQQDDPLTSSGGMSVCCSAGQERQTVLFPAPAPPGFQPEAAGSDHTRSAPVHQHQVCASDAASSTDCIVTVVDSPPLAARAVPVVAGAAAPNKKGQYPFSKAPCEAQAWWNKTFRFLRNNSNHSPAFRFILVAATIVGLAVLGQRDRLQLRLEFNVDTQKISCAVSEPLGQVKLNMLVGGSPVAHG